RPENFLGLRASITVSSRVTMILVPRVGAPRRRPFLYGAAAGIVLLAGLAVCLGVPRAILLDARQVSAAPSPTTGGPAPVAESPGQPRPAQGRVLDSDTGLPLRGASIRTGMTEVVTDAAGRFSLEIAPGQSAAVLVKTAGYERKRLVLDSPGTTIKLRP